MKHVKHALTIAAALLILLPAAAEAGRSRKEAKQQQKRSKIDTMATKSLQQLFSKKPRSKALYDQAEGYAVFDVTKVSLGITGGGGRGVAVNKDTGHRTYMKVGTAGVNLGLGGQNFQLILFFQTDQALQDFINGSWQADASANAVAGKAGANAEAIFKNGVAYYQMTDAGFMLEADISGTRFWVNEDLN